MKTEMLNWDGTGSNGTNGSVYTATVNSYNSRDQLTRVRQYQGPDSSSTYQDTTLNYDGYGRLKAKHVPAQDASTATAWDYNADDTMQKITDARGASQTFTYNARRLVTGIACAVPGGSAIPVPASVSNVYDAAGNRTAMTDGLGSMSYSYDTLSRLTSETRTIAGVGTYPLNYSYTLSGALTSVTDSFGSQVGYVHDPTGRVTNVTGANFAGVSSYASNLQYRAGGALKYMDYGNTRTLSITYNARLQPATFQVPAVMSKTYDYQPDGRRSFSHDLIDNKFDRSESYDHAGRITEALSGAEARHEGTTNLRPYKETFTYDALGHLTGRPINTIWSGPGGEFSPEQQTYQNERNTAWSYDADGNLVDSGDVQYTIDAAGQAASVVSLTMVTYTGDPDSDVWGVSNDLTQSFDGDGQVLKKTAIDSTHYFSLPDSVVTKTTYLLYSSVLGKVITEFEGATIRRGFVYLGSEVLAWQKLSGTAQTVQWEHRDPSNASFRLTSSAGTINFPERGELDPLGVNAAASDQRALPSLFKFAFYPGFASAGMGSSTQCVLDGVPTSCSEVAWLVYQNAAAQCPSNNCGPQYYANGGRWVIPRFVPSGLVYTPLGSPPGSASSSKGDPGPSGSKDKADQKNAAFTEAITAARQILQENNPCSEFFGGAGLDALNQIATAVASAGSSAFQPFSGDSRTGIRMEIPRTVSPSDAPVTTTGIYAAISPISVRINTNGAFIRRVSAGGGSLPRFGGYNPGSLESRVLQLLHETGHLVVIATSPTLRGIRVGNQTRFYRISSLSHLLALDGDDPSLSERNTRSVLEACRKQIEALRR